MKTSLQVQKIIYHHLHGEDETIEYFEELHRMSVEDSINIQEATIRATEILDADYKKAGINLIVNDCSYLTTEEQSKLQSLLYCYESLFNSTLGIWKLDPVKFELKPDAIPHYSMLYQIPHIYEQTLRKEVERLIQLGVLKKCSNSKWGSPTFIIPKQDKTVRFVTDFHKVNSLIKCKPYPLPKI